ncbi:MbtH family NRPS accessory protein [Streptomyces sp. NPDC014622]|uniref:MbtH family NRPS accessory protein n=1 Tax=Streptomyces sp. NPDC014622 TaxID=3364874 RepID=UPI0036FE23C0
MTHHVVTDGAGRHSVWRSAKRLPDGWRATGFTGTREECLDHIARVWTELRPQEGGPGTPPPTTSRTRPSPPGRTHEEP